MKTLNLYAVSIILNALCFTQTVLATPIDRAEADSSEVDSSEVSNTEQNNKNLSPTQIQCPAFLNYDFPILHSSKTINLCQMYTGKPLLIVNTASHCGYTPQFKGLEALYQKYKSEGVEIIGFTSDDFKQAAKSEDEAATICYVNYGVTFTMLSPTVVSGDRANPVFAYLASKSSSPRWNFNKYLITDNGNDVQQFLSNIEPTNSKLEQAIVKALKQP